ncbi:MAG: hypothetical protein R3362_05485 [Rhodothermales bacterium]|nr:hypothetical protein [Rhodothermales bacterium]
MTLRHRLSALLLLAAFAAGGLVAPAVHRAEHGLAHHERAAHAAAQADHVHADFTAFSEALTGLERHAPCFLCLPTPQAPALLPAAPAPFAAVQSAAPLLPARPAGLSSPLRPIRGPPAV